MFKKYLLGIMFVAVASIIIVLAVNLSTKGIAPEVDANPVVIHDDTFNSSASPASSASSHQSSSPPATPEEQVIPVNEVPVEKAPEVGYYQSPQEAASPAYLAPADDSDWEADDDGDEVGDD
ncbi:MAG: hypothetical protein Q4C74_06640 [Rothia sp. (in: high G+C Gram-positive bacteria)]|nr:hypothetical protein [Rothia sp. (in: high G+C Gram-positive bacteria)]